MNEEKFEKIKHIMEEAKRNPEMTPTQFYEKFNYNFYFVRDTLRVKELAEQLYDLQTLEKDKEIVTSQEPSPKAQTVLKKFKGLSEKDREIVYRNISYIHRRS